MLIFILLCSIAPFVQSGGKLEECKSIYACYAPQMCIDQTITQIDKSEVVRVINEDVLFENCPAFIKFHQYDDHWIHVKMETFQDSKNKIEFLLEDLYGQNKKSHFTCIKSDDSKKIEGKYEDVVKFTKDKDIPPKTSCEFEMTLDLNEKVFRSPENSDVISIKVDDLSSAKTHDINLPAKRCDPSDFKFELLPDETQVFKKVDFYAGEYFCKDKGYTIQFQNPNSASYELVTSMKCNYKKFEINGGPVKDDDWIRIRCAASVQYFCDYDVMHNGQGEKLLFDPPKLESLKKGSLKCPDGFPFLFIDKLRPLMNPTIECLNYGGNQFWTVNKNLIYLTDKGPAAYCSKTVDCHLLYRIPTKSVDSGFIGDDFLPHCFDEGTMYVDDKKIDEKDIVCDKSIGKYKYKDGDAQKEVTDATKFKCDYPSIPDDEQNIKNQEKLQDGVMIAVGSCIGAVVFAMIVVFVCSRIVAMKMKKKAEKATNDGYIKYLMNADERSKALAKKPMSSGPTTSEAAESMNWNMFLMHAQYANEMICAAPIFKPDEVEQKTLDHEKAVKVGTGKVNKSGYDVNGVRFTLALPLIGMEKQGEPSRWSHYTKDTKKAGEKTATKSTASTSK